MKRVIISLLALFFMNIITTNAQVLPDATAEADKKEAKSVRKSVEKEEKKMKKAEKKVKKAEKEKKKEEQLAKAIDKKEKAIRKNEARIVKLKDKLAKDGAKGKLSPVDKAKLETKVKKLNTLVVKDKEKLKKLVKKQ